MTATRTFNYYNDRLGDLLTFKNRRDTNEFEALKAHLDRYLAAQPKLGEWLLKNTQYDHRSVRF